MTQRTSAETFEEYLPGRLLREHRAQSSRDVFVQILARRHEQENVIIPAVPEPFIVWILSGQAVVEERSPVNRGYLTALAQGISFSRRRPLPLKCGGAPGQTRRSSLCMFIWEWP